ncbi:TIGR03618 family F420-dependent PPOX class oxidoreductase [Tepidiforma sp.]|uniref:TIGR03618 family F420-dependent PPOX class oxidoreductase n=1 Tax=Tepidiforma sp. TaxID=2682230 RepID=UPI002ADE9149|nr:TIGR03618 family F420-dependent PPOX class oxidoreductase [Tepidiforma sp.]
MPPLSRAERDAFLQQPGILCRIATVDPSGAPHVTPVWFIHEDGAIFITPRAGSAWLANIRTNPRVALAIDDQNHPYRKVTIQGTAEITHEPGEDDAWRDLYRRIARRYVPSEAADRYIAETIDQPRALIRVPLHGAVVRTWRMPIEGEPYRGIWHDRYYAPGTKLSASPGNQR